MIFFMIKINKKQKELIENNALALATVNEDGSPHCIAVGDVKVVEDGKLLIGDNYMAITCKNIIKNNKVALAVWNKDWKKECFGYEFFGTAEYFIKGKWLDKVKKAHIGFQAKGAILVTINKIKQLA